MSESNTENKKNQRSLREWENAVDKQIREAIERGDFDNLSGNGKPLDLNFNPFVPDEMRQAFRILENAGVAPDWIEQDKEIRAEKRALEEMIRDQAQWQRERAARSRSLSPHQIIAEREHLKRSRDRVSARFRERAVLLNKLIDTFNLKAPNSGVHHARIQIETEIKRFLDACKE